MMIIDSKFEIGETVYLVTDIDQLPHIVTALMIYKGGEIQYCLMCGNVRSYHYDFELSDSVNEDFKIKNI